MKMKKSLLAILAMGSVASAAHAEVSVFGNDKTTVDFYGVLDAAWGTVQHQLSIDPQFPASVNPVNAVSAKTTPANSSVNGLFNGGISDSRLGAKGVMAFDNGVNAFFTVEEGINVTTLRLNNAAGAIAQNGKTPETNAAASSLNGELFNRQAFVGLSDGNLGSVALGRNYAPMYDIAVKYDPVQNAQLFSPLGFSGAFGGGGGITEDTRVDRSLKYSNKIGSFNIGALYKYTGTIGDTGAKTGLALNGGYEEGSFGVQAAYEKFQDALSGAASSTIPDAVTVTDANSSAYMIAAKYKFNDAATAKIGYETYTLSAPSDALTLATTNYYSQTVGAVAAVGADKTTNIIWIGGDYNFTEKFNLAAGLYNVSLQQSADYVATSATNSAPKTGQGSGTQNYVSLLADYHLTKALDTYAGFMHASFSGSQYPAPTATSGYYQSNNILALGARFKW